MPTTGLAYCIVILVWATTPLAIQWSGQAVPPLSSAALRMMIAALLGMIWLILTRRGLPLCRRSLQGYAAALPPVFGAMGCSYVAAQYVPSGLISVIFGLAPLISGLIMQALPRGSRMNGWHWGGCLLGVAGLLLVFSDSLSASAGSGLALGVSLLLAGVTCFAGGGIVIQHVAAGLHPLQQTVGALLGSLPLYGIAIVATGQYPAFNGDFRGLAAIVYLAVFGSLVGFYSYFHVLTRLPAATVALITLITPVMALGLGAWLNDEQLSARVWAGAAVILLALASYLLGDRRIRRGLVKQTD